MKTYLRLFLFFSFVFGFDSPGTFAQIPPGKIWDRTLGGSEWDKPAIIIPAGDGNYLVGGGSLSNISGDKSEPSRNPDPVNLYPDFWLVKVTPSGTKIWDKTYGGYYGEDIEAICPAIGGGFLLAGSSYSNISGEKSQASKGGNDYWIVRIDATGKKLWDKTIGGNSEDRLQKAIATADGGFLLCGSSSSDKQGDKSEQSMGNYDYWVVKIDASGNKLWDKTYGGVWDDYLMAVLPTPDGGYLLAGSSSSPASAIKTKASYGNHDYWLLKIDANGARQWDNNYGGVGSDKLSDIVETADGGYILTGGSESGISGVKTTANKGLLDYWIVKVDAGGSQQWDQSFGGSQDDSPVTIKKTPDGGYLVGGSSRSPISGDKTEINRSFWEDYWLVKTNASGTLVWDKTIGGDDDDILADIEIMPDGGYLLTGFSDSGISGEKDTDYIGWGDDFWLVKLESAPGVSSVSIPENKICRGGQVNVVFKANGPLAPGNIFTAQLSDYTGKFNSPSSSATLASTASSGVISLPVPADITSYSYRIRVIASTPGSTYATNGPVITVLSGPAATVGAARTICSNSSTQLGGPVVAGNTYSWTSSPAGFTSTLSNPTVTPTVTTTYTLTETIPATGCSRTSSVVITVINKAAAPEITASGAIEICTGSSVTLTSSAAANNQWYKDNNPINGATAVTYVVNTAGIYTVVNTNSGCSSEPSAGVAVVVKPRPAAPTIQADGPLTFCQGESVLLSASDRDGYQWYRSGDPIPNSTSKTYSATTSGTYSAAAVSNGCSSFPYLSNFISITTKPAPVKPTIRVEGQSSFCEGAHVSLYSSFSSGNQWYKDGVKLDGQVLSGLTATTSGIYTVVVTSANGCSSVPSDGVTVTANLTPAAPTITASGPANICQGENVVLTSSANTGNQWYKDNVNIGTDPSYTATQAGSYNVTVTENGCTSPKSQAVIVTSNPIPSIPVITAGGPTHFCEGGNVVLTSSVASGNQWYKDGIKVGSELTYTANQTGSYTATVTQNGCTSSISAAINITVNNLPAIPVITATGNILSSSAAAGNQWYLNGTPINAATGQTYHATVSGNYTVQVTQNGCSTSSASFNFVTTGIVDPSAWNGEVKVYPNPVVKNLFITNTGLRFLQLELLDISGRKLYEAKLARTSGTIDMENLTTGIYQLLITDIIRKESISLSIIKIK